MHCEQFKNGFFTSLGAISALTLVYPVYHTSRYLCSRFFRKSKSTENNVVTC
jgi:hypothetical protein